MSKNRILPGDTVTVVLGDDKNSFLSKMTVLERPECPGDTWKLRDEKDIFYEV